MHLQDRIKKLAWSIRRLPLHPQWLILRERGPLARFVSRHASGVTLDVGCGDGWIKPQLPTGVSHYIGLDFLDTARHWYQSRPDVYADGVQLPVADASVDCVLLLNVLEHIAAPSACLGEAARALRSGGACVIEMPFLYPLHDAPRDFQRWTEFGIREACAEAGLTVIELEPVGAPLESAALLANVALSKLFLRLARKRNLLVILAVILAPVMALLVPLLNLLAAAIGCFERDAFMPYAYRVLARKA
jgi:SAM-dependent methyltransferase